MATTAALTADQLLQVLWESKGTDLLLTSGSVPMIRVDGDLSPAAGFGPLGADRVETILKGLLTEDQLTEFQHGKEIDFSFTWRDVARLRGNAFLTMGLVGLSLRSCASRGCARAWSW